MSSLVPCRTGWPAPNAQSTHSLLLHQNLPVLKLASYLSPSSFDGPNIQSLHFCTSENLNVHGYFIYNWVNVRMIVNILTFAIERTFLAWLRTSLAFASIGIAVTQLFRLNTTISEGEGLTPAPTQPGTIHLRQVGKPLGATFLGISILVLIVGGRRYFESQVCCKVGAIIVNIVA